MKMILRRRKKQKPINMNEKKNSSKFIPKKGKFGLKHQSTSSGEKSFKGNNIESNETKNIKIHF
jgi:hypothetical protein